MFRKMVQARSSFILLLLGLSATTAGATERHHSKHHHDEGRAEAECGSTDVDQLKLLSAKKLIECAIDLRDHLKHDKCVGKKSDNRNQALGATEKALRQKADLLTVGLKSAEDVKQSELEIEGTTDQSEDVSENIAKTEEDEKKDLKQLAKIRSLTSYRKDKIFANYTDYGDFHSRLNTGYEFVNLNKAFDKGLPRIGLLINLAFGGAKINELVHGWQGLDYGSRLSFSATLTSSAEQAVAGPGNSTPATGAASPTGRATEPDTTDTTKPDPQKTLEFEVQWFYPFYRTVPKFADKAPGLRAYIGPIVTFGGRKTETEKASSGTNDTISSVDRRYYYGIRCAFSPEQYWDALYGETQSLRRHRLEIRGQLPIHQLESGDRIYLGAIGNFRVKSEDNAGDVIRIYLSWNADLGKLFSSKKNSG